MAFTQGIDAARYQTQVDWQRVAAAGIAFVFVKATQANFADPLFKSHWAGAKAAGILRGAYHFLEQRLDAAKQYNAFLKTIDNDPGELPPVVDIEDMKMTDPALYTRISETYLVELEKRMGRRPIIYTAAWYWTRMPVNGRLPAWAPDYPLWVAQYPVKGGAPALSEIAAGKYTPALPKSWTRYDFWQYSEDGRVDGITHNNRPTDVDLNVYAGSLAELRTWAGIDPVEVITDPGGGTRSLPPVDMSLATNVQVMQAFTKAFGPRGGDILQATGLMTIVTANPAASYSGPSLVNLRLTDSQRTALTMALAELVGGG